MICEIPTLVSAPPSLLYTCTRTVPAPAAVICVVAGNTDASAVNLSTHQVNSFPFQFVWDAALFTLKHLRFSLPVSQATRKLLASLEYRGDAYNILESVQVD